MDAACCMQVHYLSLPSREITLSSSLPISTQPIAHSVYLEAATIFTVFHEYTYVYSLIALSACNSQRVTALIHASF